MISRRSLLSCIGSLALMATTAGCGPSWIVVKAAAPNPLRGARTFAVEPIHFDTLVVGAKTEAEYVADKTPEQAASWEADKATMNEAFFGRLSSRAEGFTVTAAPATDPSTFTVRAFVTHWEPGYYVGVSHMNSDADMTMQIVGPSGVIDEIQMHVYVAATLGNPSTGGRIRTAGDHLGAIVSRYIASRVAP